MYWIVEQLENIGEASSDLYNDYSNGDAWHHECHVDRGYSLMEAADLLDQLAEHVETDGGLWESLEPREAIGRQAAHTYGNAVYSAWIDLIAQINSEYQEWIEEDVDLDDAIREWIYN